MSPLIAMTLPTNSISAGWLAPGVEVAAAGTAVDVAAGLDVADGAGGAADVDEGAAVVGEAAGWVGVEPPAVGDAGTAVASPLDALSPGCVRAVAG